MWTIQIGRIPKMAAIYQLIGKRTVRRPRLRWIVNLFRPEQVCIILDGEKRGEGEEEHYEVSLNQQLKPKNLFCLVCVKFIS